MKRVKLQEVLDSDSYYPQDRIREMFGKKKSISIKNLVDMDISHDDKIWAVSKFSWFTDKQKRLMACDFAEMCLDNFENEYPDDKRPREAIEVSRRYANGAATTEELEAASEAASAARSAARSEAASARSAAESARSAARSEAASEAASAAASAAESAAWSEAASAARSAAWSAAWSAASARSAARSAIMKIVKKYAGIND